MNEGMFYVNGSGAVASRLHRRVVTNENALALSINKWEFIVWYIEGGFDPSLVDCGGWPTCALCLNFRTCGKCPIGMDGYWACTGTPYELFAQSPTLENARAELEFLKSFA